MTETKTKTAYLGTPGYINDPARFSNAELLKAAGANTGNLLFQYAATQLVSGKLEHVGFSGKGYGDVGVFQGLNYFIFPAANHLRADGEWKLLTGFLKKIKVPLVVLGLGAQADRGANPIKTASSLKSNRSVMEFIALLADSAQLITTRGRFSEAVCHELGLSNVMTIGCQSQFISADRNLGVNIAARLRELTESAHTARIALTASAPAELHGWRGNLESKLFQWAIASEGLYIQQSCEEWFFNGPEGRLADLTDRQAGFAHTRVAGKMKRDAFEQSLRKVFRLYFDAGRWIEDLGRVDFAIGTRIHGNMAALAAGRPGVLIAHDARVSDLADEMHVPQVDADAVLAASDYRDALKSVKFDGQAFDSGRRRKARLLVDAFNRLGVPPSKHLLTLADHV